jgi:hypothetical protein
MMRGDEKSKEETMISQGRIYEIRYNPKSKERMFLRIQSILLHYLRIPETTPKIKTFFLCSVNLQLFWDDHGLISIKILAQEWLKII